MFPLFCICPPAYYTLKFAAAARHAALFPVLGTHPWDRAMRAVYPV